MKGVVMDVSGMTLEGFFLTDYERLRRENEELRQRLEVLTDAARPSEFGVFDLGRSAEAVKVDVDSLYYAGKCDGLCLEDLVKASNLDDEQLLEWAQKTYQHKGSYYSSVTPISVKHHTYQYSLRVVETRMDATFVTDGTIGSSLFDISNIESNMEDNLGDWCEAQYEDQLKEAAIKVLRGSIDKAIDRLKGQQQ